MQAQLGLDNRQFELCALQPCSSPSGIAAVVVSYSALGGRYPISCAVQVANGVLPRLGPRAFLPRSLRQPSGEDRRLEPFPGRHLCYSNYFGSRSNKYIQRGFMSRVTLILGASWS